MTVWSTTTTIVPSYGTDRIHTRPTSLTNSTLVGGGALPVQHKSKEKPKQTLNAKIVGQTPAP